MTVLVSRGMHVADGWWWCPAAGRWRQWKWPDSEEEAVTEDNSGRVYDTTWDFLIIQDGIRLRRTTRRERDRYRRLQRERDGDFGGTMAGDRREFTKAEVLVEAGDSEVVQSEAGERNNAAITNLSKCGAESDICIDGGVVYKAEADSMSYMGNAEGENGENPDKEKVETDTDGAVFELKVDGTIYGRAREEMPEAENINAEKDGEERSRQ
eukprot:TRINITY_DN23651_c0_g2_i1.p1 TRINITY_DN23651_c0_g2~~TRINITY_DN23651_c0_g2_i1.p1  ORF type:complete len:211 (+),score=45.88 TRINITY_DN23651_c0_g2_i1:104-736(+)